MKIRIETDGDGVTVMSTLYNIDDFGEAVRARGATLTEAIENLIVRYKQLQDATLEELRARGFIHIGRAVESEGEPS